MSRSDYSMLFNYSVIKFLHLKSNDFDYSLLIFLLVLNEVLELLKFYYFKINLLDYGGEFGMELF